MTKPQLTLVENTGGWHGRANPQTHVVSAGHTDQHLPLVHQLDLFDAPTLPDLMIFIVAMDKVHGRTLQRAVLAHKPRSIIDLRYVARFDQYGSNRDTLFAYFKSAGSHYALESIPWHDFSMREFMAEDGVHIPRIHHELIELSRGTVMLFVPKPQHANMLITYLHRMLSGKAKSTWRIEQVA
ncbi:hypothetical protein [Martelella soudanensis]|uniref:hypothetical protein n=1 Tax=unclassified Martelella TaxID=2629616 RepID=UPI0015DF2AC1|nr:MULTISPECIES: hypothetical protein [unclassified Martelella]